MFEIKFVLNLLLLLFSYVNILKSLEIPTQFSQRLYQDSPQQKLHDVYFTAKSVGEQKSSIRTQEIRGDAIVETSQAEWLDGRSTAAIGESARQGEQYRWPGGIIPYVIDCSLKNLPYAIKALEAAIAEWESKTCIRFVKHTNEAHFVKIFRNTHCWANVGKIPGAALSIGDGCEFDYVMAHELGHVIGFYHEHNRQDRDRNVQVLWDNIDRGMYSAFEKTKNGEFHGTGYDKTSIMHYPWSAFTNNGEDTLRNLGGKEKIDPYVSVSALDVEQTQLMYKCPKRSRKRRSAGVSSALSSMIMSEMGVPGVRGAVDQLIAEINDIPSSPMCSYETDKWIKWCANAAAAGYCCHKHVSLMSKRCCNTCASKLKKSKPPTEQGSGRLCVDFNNNCPRYAKQGQCTKNPWYMSKICLGSCKEHVAQKCDKVGLKPKGACANPLGMSADEQGKYLIPDSAITSTHKSLRVGHWSAEARNARLYFSDDHRNRRVGAWCASTSDITSNSLHGVIVDLGKQKRITHIATQGRDKYFERVSEYKLGYSNDGRKFFPYTENGRKRIFKGNCDHVTPMVNEFAEEIVARYIIYIPLKWNYPCVRMEFYGCDLTTTFAGPDKPEYCRTESGNIAGSGDQGKKAMIDLDCFDSEGGFCEEKKKNCSGVSEGWTDYMKGKCRKTCGYC